MHFIDTFFGFYEQLPIIGSTFGLLGGLTEKIFHALSS